MTRYGSVRSQTAGFYNGGLCGQKKNKFLNARGVKWGELAKDRDAWRAREDEFVKFEA